MKKIINSPNEVVADMLAGIARANPDVKLISDFSVICRKEKSGKVGIVSGGGSGHEPAHAGYVGKGMLSAAVSGNVFSSPDPERILCAIREADCGKGVLLVIKNYSGDLMNFTMAAELAEMEDISVDYVIVKDDVSVEDSTFSTGRRGIAGTVFVHKIAGAAAESGASLKEVKRAAELAIENIRSMGMALAPCVLPGVGKPGFALAEDEIEIGMGIHGEPGVERTKILTAEQLAQRLVETIIKDFGRELSEVSIIVNGMGATPLMELYILNEEVHRILASCGIRVYKSLVGNYMTALDMAGCSITLMSMEDELKKYLNSPCDTMAWKEG